MEKKELAVRMKISLATIYNWEKTKPELMKLVKLGIKYEEGTTEKENEINILFNQLDEDEKEMYLAEIKARVLRKKINKK